MRCLYQHGKDHSRRSGIGVFTKSMFSRQKGRHDGEGHQKVLQISVRRLPLVEGCRREGAIFLPGFRTKRTAWPRLMNALAAVSSGERSSARTTAVQEGM